MNDDWPLRPYLPILANTYCFEIWKKYCFDVKVVPPRVTKLGDYRYRLGQNVHQITINENLNSYEFLTVYLHEVAHCLTTKDHGIKVKPHGSQWQEKMRFLIVPLLEEHVLPADINASLRNYILAPKAASCVDPQLTRALRNYDPPTELVPLGNLSNGTNFIFRKRSYKRLNIRRSRITCKDMRTHRMYLISSLALVKPVLYEAPF